MLAAIAIDDEPLALEVIKSLAAKVPFLEVQAYFTDAFEALTYLQTNKVDLIFLDIKMPDISGIEWVKSLSNPPMIIFTTAYSEHAVESFELDALDYLLKPFSLSRFLKAVNKAEEWVKLKNNNVPVEDTLTHVFLKSGTEQIKVLLTEIVFMQSAGNYVQFVCSERKLLARLTMNEVEELLPRSRFTRIHRSYMVADKAVLKVDRNNVSVKEGKLPIGGAYLDILEQKFFK